MITFTDSARNQIVPGNINALSSVDKHQTSTCKTNSQSFNPLRPNSDPSQTSHCNIKGLTVSEVMRIENMIIQVKFC